MTHTVIGLFDNRSEAQAAMQDLVQEGFIRETLIFLIEVLVIQQIFLLIRFQQVLAQAEE